MSKTEVLNELTKKGFDEIEPILKTERRGEIDLYCTIEVNNQNLRYFLSKELNLIHHKIDSLTANRKLTINNLQEFTQLYACIHSKVVQKKVSPEFLANVKMPRAYHSEPMLVQLFIMYGYEFREAFEKNRYWLQNHSDDENFIQQPHEIPFHINMELQFVLINNAIEAYRENKMSDFDKLQKLLDKLSEMENRYQTDSIAQLDIDRLNFNINILLLNTVFNKDRVKYSGNAIKSIAQLQQYYERHHLINAERAIKLGETAVHFDQIHKAIALLAPYATNDSVLAYMMPLAYQHVTSEGADEWYNTLIELSDKMETSKWCNMFFDECKIPFQAFDDETLRNTFCEKCMTQSDFLLNLTGKKEKKTSVKNP